MSRKTKTSMEGIRFSNIDILDAMEQIVTRHVQFYQSDFYDYDISTIKNTVGKTMIADRRFLWLPRRCGTYLFYEIDVITRIPQRKAFNYYFEQHSNTLLFAIEVDGGPWIMDMNTRKCRNTHFHPTDMILTGIFMKPYSGTTTGGCCPNIRKRIWHRSCRISAGIRMQHNKWTTKL